MFNIFNRWIQCRFKDRIAAAITLSEVLKDFVKKDEKNNTLVLGIPRGGVLTADTVSKRLHIPNFDIVIPRKLTDPNNKEQAIGAVIDPEITLILPDIYRYLKISSEYLKKEIDLQIHEIDRRKKEYHLDFPRKYLPEKMKDLKTILLVDDGISTGSTMMVTIKWIRKICIDPSLGQKRVIVAAPIIPKNIAERIKNECAVEIATVFSPSIQSFRSVEQYHENFEQITDQQVIKILRERKIAGLFSSEQN